MTRPTSDTVQIVEVSPRDGLQNEPVTLPAATKVELLDRLAATGARRIEAVSFVNPQRVPQMRDAEEVLAAVGHAREASLIGLVLNHRGVERALATDVDELNVVVPVTDEFCRRNQGTGLDQLLVEATDIVHKSKEAGRRVSVTLSVAFGCPFSGEVAPEHVLRLVERFAATDVDEIALADTIGVGDPRAVSSLVRQASGVIGAIALRCHFHNTRNTGVANVYAAFEAGVRIFDASVSGAGGCPFAPAASGNVATEDLAYLFDRMGVATGLDHDRVVAAAQWLAGMLGQPPQSMVAKAGWFPTRSDQDPQPGTT